MYDKGIEKYLPYMRVKTVGQTVHGDNARSALINLMSDLRYRPLCHECGRPEAAIHS